eukprot:jgi/Bigna1/88620/estExt_fgenesh1_pg.C_350032
MVHDRCRCRCVGDASCIISSHSHGLCDQSLDVAPRLAFITFVPSCCRSIGVGPKSRRKIFRGNYIVLGPTGSGKTNLINHMVHYDTSSHRGSGPSTDSQTLNCTFHESGVMKLHGKEVEFRFLDSIGFDAADVDNQHLFVEVTQRITEMGDSNVNAVIVIQKMDRFRTNFKNDMDMMIKMFKLFRIKQRHILLVITHSAFYSDKVQDAYREELFRKVKAHVYLKNIIHVNFLRHEELRDEFQPYFKNLSNKEFDKLSLKLLSFTDPFQPKEYLKKHVNLEKVIDNDLNGVPVLVQFYTFIRKSSSYISNLIVKPILSYVGLLDIYNELIVPCVTLTLFILSCFKNIRGKQKVA